jgi:hypothetical protein
MMQRDKKKIRKETRNPSRHTREAACEGEKKKQQNRTGFDVSWRRRVRGEGTREKENGAQKNAKREKKKRKMQKLQACSVSVASRARSLARARVPVGQWRPLKR